MLAALAASLLLAGAPATVWLQHSAPSACPDEGWLKGNVTARLGYSPFVAGSKLVARTKVSCRPASCEAVLELEQAGAPTRSRSFTAAPEHCRDLTESLALALALALDPQLLARPAPAEAAPPAAPEAPVVPAPRTSEPAPTVVLVEAPQPPPVPREPVHFHGALTGHASAGLSPAATGGAAIAAGVRYRAFGASVEVRFDAPNSSSAPGGGTVMTSVLVGTLLACGHLKGFGLCLAGTTGVMQVAGNFPGMTGRSATSPLFLAGARVLYEWMFLDWLGLHAHVEVLGVATRTTITSAQGPVWVTSPVAGHVATGAVVVF